MRINFPRSDLDVHIGDVAVPANLALTTWYGFWPQPDGSMMLMGNTVVREDDLPAVLDEVARQGLRITAIHNHLSQEKPDILYTHISGQGDGVELARKVKAVLGRTGAPMKAEGEDESASPGWSIAAALVKYLRS